MSIDEKHETDRGLGPADGESDGSRRAFLVDLGRCGAATCLLALTGCTLPVRTHRVPPTAGAGGSAIVVALADVPELRRPGGLVRVVVPQRGAFFVRREAGPGAARFSAFSAVCPHQGCLVDPAGAGFRCPCHGSTFDAEGRNTAGPARSPLTRFVVEPAGEALLRLHLDRIDRGAAVTRTRSGDRGR